jgi:ribosome-associated translation inhibitor RaiA
METAKFVILCPCCEATLTIDAQTGALLAHEEKKKPLASFEDMAKDLERQKAARENIFAQEMSAQKDRERLLDEKFKEAFKRADKDAGPYRNPLDFD